MVFHVPHKTLNWAIPRFLNAKKCAKMYKAHAEHVIFIVLLKVPLSENEHPIIWALLTINRLTVFFLVTFIAFK